MVPAHQITGTFTVRNSIQIGINTAFGGDASKKIKDVRCYEREDGLQDLYINYSDGYSKRIENVHIFVRTIIEEELGQGVQSGHGELYVLHNDKLYPFLYDINDV